MSKYPIIPKSELLPSKMAKSQGLEKIPIMTSY